MASESPSTFGLLLLLLAHNASAASSSSCTKVLPPPDWAPGVNRGDVLFSACIVGAYNSPNVGNGFVAWKTGPNCEDASCAMHPDPPRWGGEVVSPRRATKQPSLRDGQNTLGGLHLAGVFNGISNVTVSHRARIPSLFNVEVQAAAVAANSSNGTTLLSIIGAALDLRHGKFSNRTALKVSGVCSAIIEHTVYAHRGRMNVMVMELKISNLKVLLLRGESSSACAITLSSYEDVTFETTPDLSFNTTTTMMMHGDDDAEPQKSTSTAAGRTNVAEVKNYVNRTSVGLAWDAVPKRVVLTANGTTRWLAVARSSIEEELVGQDPAHVAAAAASMLEQVRAVGATKLAEEHSAAWGELWKSGIAVSGNLTVARAVNASLYYIQSAVRDDFPLGLSPGGLATNSYDGRSFWDTETWMFPVLDLLHPAIGESLLTYRLARLPAAKMRAAQFGVQGAMFPWTSQLSGFGDTGVGKGVQCPPSCTGLGWTEQHITGDIAMAFRLHWRTHRDLAFLNKSWPLIEAVCAFWTSRLVKSATSGNWTALHVTGPDESAGANDDEVYTNAVAASSFLFGIEAAAALGRTAPREWATRAASPHLPLNSSLYPGGHAVHPEFQGYHGEQITQSSVALLQYPLLWPMPTQVKIDDLTYYEARTRSNGFFTGDSVYSIAWLALGNASAAKKQWESAFAHMDIECFYTLHEELTGGHLNFITGAGGLLQNVVQGWSGVRVMANSLAVQNSVLPAGLTAILLHGLHYQGFCIDARFDRTHIYARLCCTSGEEDKQQQQDLVLVDASGGKHTLSAAAGEVVVPLGKLAFTVVTRK